MGRQTRILTILLLSSALSCQKTGLQTEDRIPMSFSDGQTKAGLSSISETFKVWASSEAEGGNSDLMPGYRVNYLAGEGWTYTSGDGTDGQELQYWSSSATRYIFFGGAPAARVDALGSESLTMSALSTNTLSETSLFSDLYIVSRKDDSFGNVVNLNFRYVQARISLSFKYVSGVPVSIREPKLIPPAPYGTEASLDFGYDRNTGKVALSAVSPLVQTSDPIIFPDVSVPEDSDVAVETSEPWYMVPDPATKGEWTLSAEINGETKETRFTISKAWEPGKSYLYRFEYTADANLVFLGTETEVFVGEDLENGGGHDFD
ncbi:MAG: fimbrillin family protein [Candidatus Cryptobacteroides sp.]